MPFISLLIPAYNEEQTIAETVQYASQLDYPNYEVIVINDGSNDKTLHILQSTLPNYSKLRVVNVVKFIKVNHIVINKKSLLFTKNSLSLL